VTGEDLGHDIDQMREGVRTAIAAWGSRADQEIRRRSPGALVATMCAAALAPVAVAVASAGIGSVALLASAGVLGSIGANSLTNVLDDVVGHLRASNRSARAIEDELRAALEAGLASGGDTASALSSETARLLRKIGGVEVAVKTAFELGRSETSDDLVHALLQLANDSADFRALLADATDAITGILSRIEHDSQVQRANLELTRETLFEVRGMKRQLVHAHRGAPANISTDMPGGVYGRWTRGSPYRGLWAFGEEHDDIFFGRSRLTSELVGLVTERLAGPSVVVVTGASGVGKSSLVCAGLLPAVADGLLGVAGSEDWPRCVLTPTTTPLAELATRLGVLGGLDALTMRDRLASRPEEASLLVQQTLVGYRERGHTEPSRSGGEPRQPRLFLVVDQFEQVFQLPADDPTPERDSYVRAIVAAATTPRGIDGVPPAVLVLSVRGDYWDRCTALPALESLVQEGQFVVGPMSEAELRQAITGPASEAGLELESGLTDHIIDELQSGSRGWRASRLGASALPLLSQAMLLTWQHREGSLLTRRSYERTGGVRNAVATSAEEAFGRLTPEERDLCRLVFVRLTQVTRSGRFARRRVRKTELVAERSDAEAVERILAAFTERRLLVGDADYVEIAHDSLLDAWPRLRGWLEVDRDSFARYGHLVERSETWLDENRSPDYLYRGTELTGVRELVNRWQAEPERYPSLPATSHEFLETSRRRDRRRRLARHTTITGLVAALLVTMVLAGVIERSADEVRSQHRIALARQLVAQADDLRASEPRVSMLLAATADHYDPLPDARRAMLDSLSQPALDVLDAHPPAPDGLGGGSAVAFSPDGRMLASGGAGDGIVYIWNTRTHRRVGAPLQIERDIVVGLAFSSDSSQLVVATLGGTVQRWRIAPREAVGEPLSWFPPSGISLSANGDRVAVGVGVRSDDGPGFGYEVWDTTSRTRIGPALRSGAPDEPGAGADSIVEPALSADGTTVAVSSFRDGRLRLFDATTGEQLGEPIAPPDPLFGLTFSPDGRWLGGLDNDGGIHVWNVETRQETTPPSALSVIGFSPRIAFTPDGRTLLGLVGDGSIRFYDTVTGRAVREPLTGHEGPVRGVAFDGGGGMATTGADGDVRLWNLRGRDTTAFVPVQSEIGATSVAASPQGQTVAIGSGSGPIVQWDRANGGPLGEPLTGHTSAEGVAYSPDGLTLASVGGDDESLRLWDAATGQPLGQPLTAHGFDVEFSPDGRVLAVAGYPTMISLWDVRSQQSIGELRAGPSDGSYFKLAFSPDGRFIVAVAIGGLWVWNADTMEPARAPLPSGGYALAFRPDSSTFAYVDSEGHIAFRDVSTGRAIGEPISSRQNGVTTLAFTPDGRILAAGGTDGTVRFWDVETHEAIGSPLPAHTGGVNEVTFTPDGQTLVSAGLDDAARLWNVAFPADPVDAVCAAAGSLTEAEWTTYLEGEAYVDVCRER
jgi:WD40 repeat protein